MQTLEQQRQVREKTAEKALSLLSAEKDTENNNARFTELIERSHDKNQILSREELVEISDRKNFDTLYHFLAQRRDDTTLMNAIVKNIPRGASIKGALRYAHEEAQTIFSSTTKCAMVDDYTVFMWVRTYFISFIPPELKTTTFYPKHKSTPKSSSKTEQNSSKSPKDKSKVEFEEITLDLF